MKKVVAITLAGLVLAGTLSQAWAGSTYQVRTSTNAAATSTLGQYLTKFTELLNEKSDGRLKATANYGAELGVQSEQVEMARAGALEIVVAAPGTGPGAWVPQLMMFEFPFIFKDNAQYRRMLKAMEAEVSDLVKPFGLLAFGGVSQGSRHMLTVKPVRKLEDMRGLKMRGPNSIYISMFQNLGAAGTTMDWNEIYTALQTRIIDGMEASPSMINSMKFQDNAKYLAITNHIIACAYLFPNAKWFEGLPADLQQLIRDCANEAVLYQQQIDDADQGKSLDDMKKAGVEINEMPDIEKWAAACKPMLDEYRAKGAAWSDFIDKMTAVK